jgi:hypothetical protein
MITWRFVMWARQLQMRSDPLAAIHLSKTPLNILAQIAQNLREINHIFLPLFQGGSPQPRGNSMFKVKIFY